MNKYLGYFLGAALACISGVASADIITTFDVSGTADGIAGQSCGSNCQYSGTLTVDVTTGVAKGIDVTFPGLPAFNAVIFSGPFSTSDWSISATNSTPGDLFFFDFTTTHTPGSLVDFAGGAIFIGLVSSPETPFYVLNEDGTITPSVSVPEPATLALLGIGLAGLGFSWRRKLN